MESEVSTYKKRYMETRLSYKELKREMREQRDKTRQIIAICGSKLQEKENEVIQIRGQRDEELAKIARELLFLRSNMLKEQKRLESIINDQKSTIQRQNREIANLRQERAEEMLANHHHHHDVRAVTPNTATSDMDTPTSSEDGGSPKSSFNKGVIDNSPKLTPPALPPRRNSSTSSSSSSCSSGSGGKPPIPSRAGVNRKLLMKKEDYFNNNNNNVNNVNGLFTGDEGFCSSHEDHHPTIKDHHHHHQSRHFNNASQPSRTLTNHRGVQKPSEVKYRSKLRSTSNLGALEEHQVISNAPITTVTYLDYF